MAEVNVGAIKVTIGGETFELTKVRKKSEKEMAKISKNMDDRAKKIAATMKKMGARIAIAMAAVTLSIRNALIKIDEMGNASQALGLTVEQFTQLRFAAGQASVGIDIINQAMSKLLANAKATDELSEGVILFRALGVSAKDSSGRIRNLQRILIDMADKFSRMNDSAEKSQLAMRVFGEEAGRRMIPFLNLGSEAIQDLINKSDLLGATISSNTTAAVAQFNAKIERVKASSFALATDWTKAFLPALNRLTDDLIISTTAFRNNAFAQQALALSAKIFETVFTAVGKAIKIVLLSIQSLGKALINLSQGEFRKALGDIKKGFADVLAEVGDGADKIKSVWDGWIAQVRADAPEFPKMAAPIIGTAAEIAKSFGEARSSVAMLVGDLLASDITPFTEKFRVLGDLMKQGVIDWRTFGQAWKDVKNQQIQAQDDLVSASASALGQLFDDNKAVAIGIATVNTLQGITQALKSYPPPISYGMAAAQAAIGFAQVAKIRSTNKNSGGTASSGSVGSTPAPTNTQAVSGPSSPQQTLTVEGVDPNTIFSGGNVRGLVEELLQFQRDGGRVILA